MKICCSSWQQMVAATQTIGPKWMAILSEPFRSNGTRIKNSLAQRSN
jgi:hypothetical protein